MSNRILLTVGFVGLAVFVIFYYFVYYKSQSLNFQTKIVLTKNDYILSYTKPVVVDNYLSIILKKIDDQRIQVVPNASYYWPGVFMAEVQIDYQGKKIGMFKLSSNTSYKDYKRTITFKIADQIYYLTLNEVSPAAGPDKIKIYDYTLKLNLDDRVR